MKNKPTSLNDKSSKKLKPYIKQVRSASKIYYFPQSNFMY